MSRAEMQFDYIKVLKQVEMRFNKTTFQQIQCSGEPVLSQTD